MSAFLGPIHFWVYNKIQIQQGIVDNIIEAFEGMVPGLKEKLDSEYGGTERRPLEQVIDESNIHGWLQKNVTQAEFKLAESVTTIIGKDPEAIGTIKKIFWEKGKELSGKIEKSNASSAYKVLNDSLLDGMPCDHANNLLENSEEKVVWQRNICVHRDFWEAVGGEIDIYYSLREEFIKGTLQETGLEFEKADENTSIIKRGDLNV